MSPPTTSAVGPSRMLARTNTSVACLVPERTVSDEFVVDRGVSRDVTVAVA